MHKRNCSMRLLKMIFRLPSFIFLALQRHGKILVKECYRLVNTIRVVQLPHTIAPFVVFIRAINLATKLIPYDKQRNLIINMKLHPNIGLPFITRKGSLTNKQSNNVSSSIFIHMDSILCSRWNINSASQERDIHLAEGRRE